MEHPLISGTMDPSIYSIICSVCLVNSVVVRYEEMGLPVEARQKYSGGIDFVR